MLARGVDFLKVKVIEVKGQISVLARGVHFLKFRVIEVKGHSRSSRSKVKFLYLKGQIYVFFCLFPYFSQVIGPIFNKLGGKVDGGPGC